MSRSEREIIFKRFGQKKASTARPAVPLAALSNHSLTAVLAAMEIEDYAARRNRVVALYEAVVAHWKGRRSTALGIEPSSELPVFETEQDSNLRPPASTFIIKLLHILIWFSFPTRAAQHSRFAVSPTPLRILDRPSSRGTLWASAAGLSAAVLSRPFACPKDRANASSRRQ